MSVELPLSTRTLLVLKASIMSIMTKGSSCGCFTPIASSFEKTISKVSLDLHLDGGAVWTMLTCLCYNFLRDLNDLFAVGPLLIILISPMVLFG